jgi:hypothetical protein
MSTVQILKFAFLLIVVSFAATCTVLLANDTSPDPSNTEIAAAADVGKAVQRALLEADSTGLSNLALQKAVVSLETGRTTVQNVEISFIIFTISHSKKKGATQSTSLTFERMPRPAGSTTKKIDDLTEPLARAIANAAAVASQINVLQFSEATVKLEFVVEKTTGGKISFKVLGANIGPEVDLEKTSKNSIEVTFSR